jgi:hypothetical protein
MLPEVTVNGQMYPQVASDPQSTNNASFGAYNASNPAGNGGPSFGVGNVLGDASSALNIYNGLNRGGFSGYGGATVSAMNLANKLGLTSIPGVGPLGSALGIYNGIKQGGVAGDLSAGLSAATLGSQLGAAGVAGFGAMAGLAPFLGPLSFALPGIMMALSDPSTKQLNEMGFYKDATMTQPTTGQYSQAAGFTPQHWQSQFGGIQELGRDELNALQTTGNFLQFTPQETRGARTPTARTFGS